MSIKEGGDITVAGQKGLYSTRLRHYVWKKTYGPESGRLWHQCGQLL